MRLHKVNHKVNHKFMQASSFFNKNPTNTDNDNSMNISTEMEMSLVNKLSNLNKFTFTTPCLAHSTAAYYS